MKNSFTTREYAQHVEAYIVQTPGKKIERIVLNVDDHCTYLSVTECLRLARILKAASGGSFDASPMF